jgi:hypothetical protein
MTHILLRLTIVSYPDDEPQLLTRGLDEGRPGRVNLPPRAEVDLRGRFGPHIAFDMRVGPVHLADYLGSPPRLTLVRAFLCPPLESDDSPMRSFAWGGGVPSREDLEDRPPGPEVGSSAAGRAGRAHRLSPSLPQKAAAK